MVSRDVVEALEKHGIRYWVIDGELYLDGSQTSKVLRLCEEGKLPKHIC